MVCDNHYTAGSQWPSRCVRMGVNFSNAGKFAARELLYTYSAAQLGKHLFEQNSHRARLQGAIFSAAPQGHWGQETVPAPQHSLE